MDVQFQAVMSPQERADTANWVNAENKDLAMRFERNVDPNQAMGKDDFLRILLTQLAHQDPTAPMQDKEFIAQMAQFSSLEQMTNMASDFAKMARMLQANEAVNSLGRAVEVSAGETTVQGVIQAVTRDESPQILVNGKYFNWDQVVAVYDHKGDN